MRVPKPPGRLCLCLAESTTIAQAAYQRLWSGEAGSQAGSIALFQAALRADPASPYRWSDLGEAYLATGQPDLGRHCLQRAVELGPNLPQILLRAANFSFRTGQEEAGARYCARVLALTPDYDAAVFGSYERLGIAPETILGEGLPAERRAAAAFFRYTLSKAREEPAAATWNWMTRNGLADDGLAGEYSSFLLGRRQFAQAAAIWAAQLGARDPEYRKTNLLSNGRFTREPAASPLDWTITPVAGVQISRDSAGPPSGGLSLRIEFSGTANLEYGQVAQAVVVEPGAYRFTAFARSAEITTDQGMGFRITDRENPGRLDIQTPRLRGTEPWTPLTCEVRVPQGTSLLEVQVYRPPSSRFDNQIRGTAWVGDVQLKRVGAPQGR